MIQKLTLRRFKGIEEASCSLGPINALLGANNSGKSSIIQGIHFSVGVIQSVELLSLSFRNGSTSLNPTQLIYSPSESVYSLGAGGTLREDLAKAIEFEFVLNDGRQCEITIRKGKNRNINVAVSNPSLIPLIGSLTKPFSIFSPGLAGISKAESYVSDGVLMRTLARGDANLVLRNILLRLWATDEWGAFMDDIHQIFPDIGLRVAYLQETDEFITVFTGKDDCWLPLELAGTGLLQAAQILSYIHRFKPSIVVLDEPDSHLHPNNQRLLCALLRLISQERDTQVILTTHSRHMLDALGGQCLIYWVRRGSVHLAQPEDEIGILLDVGALDIKERAANPKIKAIVLTEDERTRPLEIILRSSGFEMEETEILSYYGCTQVKNLRPLIRMIQASNPNAKLVLHMDRDFRDDTYCESWAQNVRALNVDPFVTEGTDIEYYYLNSKHLSSLPNDNAKTYFDLLQETVASAIRNELIEKLVNGQIDHARKEGRMGATNIGSVAAQASALLDRNSIRYRHSKTLLARMKQQFRDDNQKNLIVFSESSHLKVVELESVARQVWRNS